MDHYFFKTATNQCYHVLKKSTSIYNPIPGYPKLSDESFAELKNEFIQEKIEDKKDGDLYQLNRVSNNEFMCIINCDDFDNFQLLKFCNVATKIIY